MSYLQQIGGEQWCGFVCWGPRKRQRRTNRQVEKRVVVAPITCTRKEQIKDDAYEMKELVIPEDFQKKTPAKKSGLRRAPSSGGVRTATFQYSLPSPAGAVRNLLELGKIRWNKKVILHSLLHCGEGVIANRVFQFVN
eukprot:TRINITY_DN23393_c0_g1_i2.p3 TRINITY_DN23393_c0_g1~~TRINITY_DN23393_c0_g1_i2.p3  ORF type:complete len:138 (-),score=24.60 TRINITY_DN23393_c0_g1_i2:73-486(-)